MSCRLKLLLLISLSLSACATEHVSLKKAASDKLKTIDQFIIVEQGELEVHVASTKAIYPAVAGEMMSALIDKLSYPAEVEKANPVSQELEEFNIRIVLRDAMNREMSNKRSLGYTVHSQVAYDEDRKNNFDQSRSTAVLFSSFVYQLSSGNLILNAEMEMYPKSNLLNSFRINPDNSDAIDKGNVIYRNTFSYRRRAVTSDNIKRSLREGAASIARQLAEDLGQLI